MFLELMMTEEAPRAETPRRSNTFVGPAPWQLVQLALAEIAVGYKALQDRQDAANQSVTIEFKALQMSLPRGLRQMLRLGGGGGSARPAAA